MNPNPSEYPAYVKYLREQFNELYKEHEKTLKRAEAAEARVNELEQMLEIADRSARHWHERLIRLTETILNRSPHLPKVK